MASVNKVILIGNCGRDPEVRYTPSGTAICNVSVATSSRRKDKASGESIEDTQWHRVTFYDRLAEIAGEYLKKGRTVYIEGSLRTDSWDDKQTGQKKYMTEVVANDLVLLGGRGEGGGGGDYAGSSRGASSSSSASAGGNSFDQSAPEPEHAPAGSSPITDEDIPF